MCASRNYSFGLSDFCLNDHKIFANKLRKQCQWCSNHDGLLRNCKILSHLSTPVTNNVLFSSKSAEKFIEDVVKSKLKNALQPEFLEVVNESAKHNVPRGSASHIRVTVVSPLFNNKNLVQRHRLVNAALQEELKGPIHALSIVAVSSSEVTEKEPEKTESPPCRGGSGL